MRKIALETRKLARSLAVLAAILLSAVHAAPAHAAPYLVQTWVSHNGGDSNFFCSQTSPCASFAYALALTANGGELSCLDSGSFGQITVISSVTINCSGTVAITVADGITCTSAAIVINAPGKVVTLRGLDVNGFGLTANCLPNGIIIQAAAAVHIEDCVIENFQKIGILDERTTGLTTLVIKNTIVRNNGSPGIVLAAAPKNSVVLENVQSVGNTYGIAVATGNNVVVNRSVMSENSVAGIEADAGAFIFVDNTVISQNANFGILAQGTVGIANSDLSFNTSSISGATMSYGNNRVFLDGPGTAPTPVGGASTDFGQQ